MTDLHVIKGDGEGGNDNEEKVVSITPERLEEFKRKKIVRDDNDDIDLEAVAGSPVVGELTSEEIEVFKECTYLEDELFEWGREIAARSVENLATATRSAETPQDIYANLVGSKLFNDKSEAEQYFYDMAKLEYLQNFFWFSVRERLQTFASKLSIRAGYKVCWVASKYEE